MSPHRLGIGKRYLISWRVPLHGGDESGKGVYEVLGRELDGKWRLRSARGAVLYLFAHEMRNVKVSRSTRKRR